RAGALPLRLFGGPAAHSGHGSFHRGAGGSFGGDDRHRGPHRGCPGGPAHHERPRRQGPHLRPARRGLFGRHPCPRAPRDGVTASGADPYFHHRLAGTTRHPTTRGGGRDSVRVLRRLGPAPCPDAGPRTRVLSRTLASPDLRRLPGRKDMKAIIVGAGPAGLATAWWLRRAGWECLLIEHRPSAVPISLSEGAARGVLPGGYAIDFF